MEAMRNPMRTMVVVLVASTAVGCAIAGAGEDPEGVGLTPPLDGPEVFAPGVISLLGSSYRESQLSMWPDGRRVIFSRYGPGIPDGTVFESRLVEGIWSRPEPTALFEDSIALEPGLAPDGNRLFYSMPAPGHGLHDIFVMEWSDGSWTEPRRLFRGLYASAALDGTIYYTGYIGWRDHIVYRRFVDGEYTAERAVGAPVYSRHEDAHPCVAPDGSYLIFDSSTRPHDGACLLFVSFRNDDGSWTEPVNMGAALGGLPAGLPRVSPDGRILFFNAHGEIYWIDTSVLGQLR